MKVTNRVSFQQLKHDEKYGELRRKLFHVAYGSFLIILILFLHKNAVLFILLVLLLIGLLLSLLAKFRHLPIITTMLLLFDRERDLKTFPGRGAITFTLGIFLAVFFFTQRAYFLGSIVLTVSDSVATLVGKYLGKKKVPFLKNKTVEGSFSFFVSTMILSIITTHDVLVSIVVSLVAMLSEMLGQWLDDNLLVPTSVGLSYMALSIILAR